MPREPAPAQPTAADTSPNGRGAPRVAESGDGFAARFLIGPPPAQVRVDSSRHRQRPSPWLITMRWLRRHFGNG